MIRIEDQEHIDELKEVLSKSLEVFKVFNAYTVDGVVNAISERLKIGDLVSYIGRCESGKELITIFSKIKEYKTGATNLPNSSIQNEVVSFIKITKNKKYESKEIKMSVTSFMNMIESVMDIMNRNKINDMKGLEDLYTKLDNASEEYKALQTYLSLYTDHLFSFILVKYNLIIDGIENEVRTWYISDFNDKRSRARYDWCTEFKVML